MESSFWSEGPTRLRNAMSERRAEIDELLEHLKLATDPAEMATLKRQLRDILDEYEPTVQEIEGSLFFGSRD